MEYVNFGSAGVKVSPVAVGMGLRGQRDEQAAARMIHEALDVGINLFDCANMYGLLDDREHAGTSEVILGRALKAHRDDVVITTKVNSETGPGPNDRGTSRYHVMREVEQSLRRLDTDRIDVYILHNFDRTTPMEETLRAMDDLVRQGKVRYVGCSNFAAWQVCKGLWTQDRLGLDSFICVQNQYSLVNRGLEREMFGLARDQGLGVMAYSPLGVGLLTGLYSRDEAPSRDTLWGSRLNDVYRRVMSDEVWAVIETVRELGAELDKTPAQVALAWVLSQPEVTVAITGADTAEHVQDNAGAVGWTLPPEARARLDAVSATMTEGLGDN